MARRNYLVEGLSGTGKSSVYEELIRRGYRAVSTDRAWKDDASLWDPRKALSELERLDSEVLFVCGSSANRDRFLPYFTKVFNLRVDDDTMRRRLVERTNNDFGKDAEELELMLTLNRRDEKPAGAIDVDGTQPLPQVVDDVLRLAGCRTQTDPAAPPWSTRGSATGQSFVISVSDLQRANDAVREAGTRIDYSWSGDLLVTLLRYLDAQGIDLAHSGHDDAPAAIAQTHESRVFVLTFDQRERHLARLDPAAFDGNALRRYYESLNETDADGVGYAMLDGIAFLRDTLAPLRPGTVALLVIGV